MSYHVLAEVGLRGGVTCSGSEGSSADVPGTLTASVTSNCKFVAGLGSMPDNHIKNYDHHNHMHRAFMKLTIRELRAMSKSRKRKVSGNKNAVVTTLKIHAFTLGT